MPEKFSTGVTRVKNYLSLAYSNAREGFSGANSPDTFRGRLGIAGGWLSSVIIYVFAVLPNQSVKNLWLLPILIPVFFLVLGGLFKTLASVPRSCKVKDSMTQLLSAVGVSVILFVFFLYVVKCHGMDSSPDTQWQWQQVETGKFDDWHPVIHTFSIYLFSRIYCSSFFVAGCFIAIFSGYCGWFYHTLRRYNFKLWTTVLLLLLVAISPVTVSALRVLWKDSAFMITLFGVGVAMINIWFSKGLWLEKWYNQIFLAVLLVYAAFVRHNGIFFTIPFIVLLPLLAESRKQCWKMLAFSGVVLVLCGGYIVGRSEMIKHNIITQGSKDQSFHEAVGIPMSMMTHAYVNAPEKLPPEVKDFMSAKLPWEKWKELYKGDFNSVKFNAPNLMGDITPKEFFGLFFKTLKAAPCESFYALFHVTSVAWSPDWCYQWLWIMNIHKLFERMGIGWIFAAAGLYCLIMIVLSLYLLPQRGWKLLFISLPFLCYNYGTALLLMGWDQRFFWGVIVGSVPVIAILFAECLSVRRSEQQAVAEEALADLPTSIKD